MEYEKFKKIIVVMALCQNAIDGIDLPEVKHLFKGDTKRKLNMALKSLERDSQKYIDKIYETDDELFQSIQGASKVHLEYLIEKIVHATN